MDQAALVERDIEEGRRLIQALDGAQFPVVAAFWNYFPEEGQWRLLIASPKVNELGPRGAYAAIQEGLLRAQVTLPLYRISAVNPEEPLVADLRIFAGTDSAPFLGSTYFHHAVIGDTYVERAYVYRAERIIGLSGTFDCWVAAPRDRSRKVWTAHRCKVVAEDGLIKQIEAEGLDWPQTRSKQGVNAHLDVLGNTERRGDETFGDVQRLNILAGRLRSVETVAKGIRIDGYAETAAPSGAPT